MTWNGQPMTLRAESSADFFTAHNGGTWGTNNIYLQNLPADLKEKMPLFGTNDVNTGDSNSLYLPTKTIGYMFRPIGWAAVDMTGWTAEEVFQYMEKGQYVRLLFS